MVDHRRWRLWNDKPISTEVWDGRLREKAVKGAQRQNCLYVVDVFSAEPTRRHTPLRALHIMEVAWQAHFVTSHMFIRPQREELKGLQATATSWCSAPPGLKCEDYTGNSALHSGPWWRPSASESSARLGDRQHLVRRRG